MADCAIADVDVSKLDVTGFRERLDSRTLDFVELGDESHVQSSLFTNFSTSGLMG